MPLVSVITPSYNQMKFLEKTMHSVLDQDYPDLEYFVMDGGSTDGSVEVIQKYADRLTGWVSEPDRGQADAVNKGFQRARGEYIGWLNSDDLYQPGSIRRAVECFQTHPEAGMVFGDVLAIDGDGRAINLMKYGNWGLPDLMTFHIIGQPGVFFRRSILEKTGGLDLSYHFLLDHHLWLRMAALAPMVYQPETQASARFHPAAKNRAQAALFGQEAYRLAAWLETEPVYAAFFPKLHRQVWAGAHRMNALYLLDGHQPLAALKAYWQ